ncbi:MAG: endoglucanase [Flavobacteriales bacterium]|jgi:endoglucanase
MILRFAFGLVLLMLLGCAKSTLKSGTPGVCPDNCVTISAQYAVAQMGKGVNLGQMFESDQHPPTMEKAVPKIDAYYDRGFRNIRIPVTWTEKIADVYMANPDTGRVHRDGDRLGVLKEVIDYALSKPGMYVVLNAHHEKRLKDENRAAVLEQLWHDISDIFKERDHRLIFEILNEPHLTSTDPMLPENLRKMTELAYKNIRIDDKNRLIAIGGNQWFAAGEMAKTWPNLDQVGGGKDSHLMATFHHYDPWEFSGDSQGDYADKWTDENISEPMDTMIEWSKTIGNNMPIFIGEWGVGWGSRYGEMRCNNIRLWYSKFDKEYASKKGIATVLWDDGGWFKVFDHNTNSFNNNLAECIDGECEIEGKERYNEGCL